MFCMIEFIQMKLLSKSYTCTGDDLEILMILCRIFFIKFVTFLEFYLLYECIFEEP